MINSTKMIPQYNGRWLVLITLTAITGVAQAQKVSVEPDVPDARTLVKEKAGQTQVTAFTGVMENDLPARQSAFDSLKNVPTVFSEKTIRQHQDSLRLHGLIDRLARSKQRIDRGDYLQKVREAFANELSQAGSQYDQSLQALTSLNIPTEDDFDLTGRVEGEVPPVALADFDLDKQGLEDLPPLHGTVLDSGQIGKLTDNEVMSKVRSASQWHETDLSSGVKEVLIPRKPGFFDRWYAEGVLGVTDFIDNDGVAQLSPALAYRFYGPFSIGIGPDVQLVRNSDQTGLKSGVGYRSFLKANLYQNSTYLHVENIYNSRLVQDGDERRRHRFYAGGGYIMRLSPSWGLNFSLLYQLDNSDIPQGTAPSPWLFRLGFSTLKKSKE